jgi:hypothetical protein
MRAVIALCVAGFLAGCAASGVKVSEQQAEAFKVGSSTYNDVVAALGAPTTSTVTAMAVYSYAAVRSQPQNFIPYIGPLVAGYDTQSSAVTFTFNQAGVLTGTSSTQTGMGTGANLAAGNNAATAPYQQPR